MNQDKRTQEEFDQDNDARYPELNLGDQLRGCFPSRNKITLASFGYWLLSWFPFFLVLKRYKRAYFVKDLIAGFTVGVMNVPQGMAYGLLAGLEPVYGLYVTLILPVVYALFTDSHHVAMGTFAIVSLIVNGVVHKVQGAVHNSNVTEDFWCGIVDSDSNQADSDELVEIAVSLTLLVGLIQTMILPIFGQIILGVLHFGFLASYLSESLVKGLTTGAAVHVMVSQLSHATGINGLPVTGVPLGIFKFIGCFIGKISTINGYTVGFTAICFIIIYIVKVYIDPKTRPKIRFPIPIDLTIVIIATGITYGFELNTKFNIEIVGNIPKRLPTFQLPNLKWFDSLIADAITLAFVSYSLNASLGKLYGKQFGYSVSQNQEWFAIGFAHLFGSFFQCHPGGSSMSRSQVQSTAGGKTQVVSFVSSLMILLVILFIANLFNDLPKCALAAIIIVALRKLVFQVKELPGLYRKSKVDAAIWIVTCLAVLILDVSTGLALGVVFALLTVIFRQQWASSKQMGPVDITYKTLDAYGTAKTIPGVMILRLDAPLSFINVETFTNMVHRETGIEPLNEKRAMRERNLKLQADPETTVTELDAANLENSNSGPVFLNENGCAVNGSRIFTSSNLSQFNGHLSNTVVSPPPETTISLPERDLKYLILDCGSVSYIDVMGVECLQDVYKQFEDIGVTVYFANCKLAVRQMQEKCKFFSEVSKAHLFPTIEMAVAAVKSHTLIINDSWNPGPGNTVSGFSRVSSLPNTSYPITMDHETTLRQRAQISESEITPF